MTNSERLICMHTRMQNGQSWIRMNQLSTDESTPNHINYFCFEIHKVF